MNKTIIGPVATQLADSILPFIIHGVETKALSEVHNSIATDIQRAMDQHWPGMHKEVLEARKILNAIYNEYSVEMESDDPIAGTDAVDTLCRHWDDIKGFVNRTEQK